MNAQSIEPYDPLLRISQEADSEVAKSAIELCARFFMASTSNDFSAIIQEAKTSLSQQPRPIDPLQFLYEALSAQSQEREMFLKVLSQWGQGKYAGAQAVGIEPSSWKVTLKTEDGYWEVDAEMVWDRESDEPVILIRSSGEAQPEAIRVCGFQGVEVKGQKN